MEKQTIIAVAVFLVVYGLLIWDKIERAIVSLLGASIIILLGVLDQDTAVAGVDFNTIGLLIGMMITVNICQKTGMFQYLAIRSAKLAKGKPWRILVYLTILTALLSALLDNVTTVLLIAPITLLIADELRLTPYPFLFAEITASNIGGTATLIGDPPNIMIGSAAKLSFMDFVVNVAPAVPFVLICYIGVLWLVFGKKMKVDEAHRQRILAFREEDAIKDGRSLKICIGVLIAVVAGFVLHSTLHLEAATIAIAGATILLLLTRESFHDMSLKVEWTSIFFFVGLFILVHGLVETGVIKYFAQKMLTATGGDLSVTAYSIIWGSAVLSAFVDNIPFVATMIPLLNDLATHMGGAEAIKPLWWALSLGACLGGNGTIIGASANVIVAGISAKSGHPIGFVKFMLLAFPLMLASVAIGNLYIYLRFFL
ncbi:MAG: ArsB/NhaD family transporter [Deltaproteobacteria bacterium]|nr:ArsB/NhaD family transporter [Deltaproteobacteria bacterium]